MALIDITNVNPWEAENRASAQAYAQRNQALQGVFDNISRGIQAGQARRAKQDEQDRAFRDREYAIIDNATAKLVQPNTNNKFTDVQLQQAGQEFKQDFYAAVKEYENSDKGDEARQKFNEAKQKALGSARTISGSLESLGEQMESFRQMYKDGGINPATDPAVREFFADLNDPATPPDHYQIVEDEETGQLKYVGKTTQNGHDVSFFLEDIANGENQFAPLEKVDMPSVLQNLMKGVTAIKKQEQRDWGVAEVTDWDAIGNALDGRMNELLKDDTSFKQIAGGLGYTYEEIMNADPEDLRKEIKQELLQQIEQVTPHEVNDILSNTERQRQAEAQKQQVTNIAVNTRSAIQAGEFDAYQNKTATIKGLKGNIAKIQTLDSGKVEVTIRSGQKGGAKQVFEPNDPQLYAILNGTDYHTAALGIQELNRIDKELSEIAL